MASESFFFFEYYLIGYDKTITEAKMHANAGIKIIEFLIKEISSSSRSSGYFEYASVPPTIYMTAPAENLSRRL